MEPVIMDGKADLQEEGDYIVSTLTHEGGKGFILSSRSNVKKGSSSGGSKKGGTVTMGRQTLEGELAVYLHQKKKGVLYVDDNKFIAGGAPLDYHEEIIIEEVLEYDGKRSEIYHK